MTQHQNGRQQSSCSTTLGSFSPGLGLDDCGVTEASTILISACLSLFPTSLPLLRPSCFFRLRQGKGVDHKEASNFLSRRCHKSQATTRVTQINLQYSLFLQHQNKLCLLFPSCSYACALNLNAVNSSFCVFITLMITYVRHRLLNDAIRFACSRAVRNINRHFWVIGEKDLAVIS